MQIPIILNQKSTISRQISEVQNCNGSATLFNTFLKQRLEDAEGKRIKNHHEKIARGAWLLTTIIVNCRWLFILPIIVVVATTRGSYTELRIDYAFIFLFSNSLL